MIKILAGSGRHVLAEQGAVQGPQHGLEPALCAALLREEGRRAAPQPVPEARE